MSQTRRNIRNLNIKKKNRLLYDLIVNLSYNQFLDFEEELEGIIDYDEMIKTYDSDLYAKLENEDYDPKNLYFTLLKLEEQDAKYLDSILDTYDLDKLFDYMKKTGIEDVPEDVFNYEIIKYMDYTSITSLCVTNKEFSKYCQDWEKIFETKYPKAYEKSLEFIDPIEQRDYKKLVKLFEEINENSKVSNYTKYLEIVIQLVEEYNKDPAVRDNEAIRWAAEYGHLEVVKYLMSLPEEYGIDPAADNNYAIKWAAGNGHLEFVKYLMSLPEEYGIDPAAEDNFVIAWAAAGGHLEVVKYLMSLPEEYGIDPDAGENNAIEMAEENGYEDIVEYIRTFKNK